MYSSKTKLFPEEVLNLQPNFPKKGVTCENYITDAFQKKSFYSWDNDLKIKSSSDEKIKRFLELPTEVRQAGHQRIFGNGWACEGTKKSMLLASQAFFEPDSPMLKARYQLCESTKMMERHRLQRQENFLKMIEG